MRCPACGSEFTGGVGTRCPRCGFLPRAVAVTPMEYVVHAPTGTHRIAPWQRYPWTVRLLYLFGVLAWGLPLALVQYFRVNPMPGTSIGWRTLGVVLALMLAAILHTLLWAGAFFYSRLITSNEIADEAKGAG